MSQYIVRRLLLMIPTLIGVTIVSFAIIQLSPGDPLLNQSAAKSGQTGQSHEVYLVQKRALGLDKPILLNFRGFTDYSMPARFAAHCLGLEPNSLENELAQMAPPSADPELGQRRKFLEHLKISNFDQRLEHAEGRPALAEEVSNRVHIWCEDQGDYAVPATIALLEDKQTDLVTRRGAVRALNDMLVDSFVYTYSREPRADETPQVLTSWKTWWSRAKAELPPVSEERRAELKTKHEQLAHEPLRAKVMQQMEQFRKSDVSFFADRLLGDSSLAEKNIAALVLRLYWGKPLRSDVPVDADQQLVDEVAANWINYAHARPAHEQAGFWTRLGAVFADTQYGRLVWRLARFDFGRSALKTREPVGDKIWRAVKVSAPLMILSEVLVYLFAVPLGVLCAVYRETWTDRLVSFVLFLLYSVPSFVAAMILLSLFAYGKVAEWFPMEGLHGDGAEEMGWAAYLADYAWHAFLPLVCLSVFSLAGLAMYARTSMLDVLTQDYIRTARSVGVPGSKILFKHALRNALIPIVTLFADFLPALFGGSVLVEVLFGIPGMGRLTWASIGHKDYPTLMALVYIDAILMLVSILISDLLYVLVDPRISFEASEETT